jgi:type II secretory pathway pseudopilin PulG
MKNHLKLKKAFSFIEVLVFIAVFSVFFVVAATIVTASLRNLKYNEHKVIATHYAEQLMEWLKSSKEVDSNAFFGKGGYDDTNPSNVIGNFYCFNTKTIQWPSQPIRSNLPTHCGYPAADPNNLPSTYSRSVEIIHDNQKTPFEATVKVRVYWQDNGADNKVELSTILASYE